MNDKGFRILIVDDEPNIRSGLTKALAGEADVVDASKNGAEAMTLFQKDHYHLVITDMKMPGPISGLDLVKQIKHDRPETLILVITAHGSVETAVEAMRQGAQDYINKPVDLGMLRLLVRNAYDHHRLVTENRQLRERLAATGEFPEMIGHSAAIREVFDRIRQVADTEVTVLIQGRAGPARNSSPAAFTTSAPERTAFRCGKPRAAGVAIESELFGYERGHSRERTGGSSAGLRRRRAGPYSWTRLGKCQPRLKSICSGTRAKGSASSRR